MGGGLYFFKVGAWKRSFARWKELPRSVRIVLAKDLPIVDMFVLWNRLLVALVDIAVL